MAALTVGSGMQFSTIKAAVAASHDGDTIYVQAGTYVNDFALITTDINLVGGDVTTMISEKLLGADQAELRATHQAAVTQAQQIVQRNAEILVSIAKEIGNQLGALPAPSTPGPVRSVSSPP